MESNKEVPLVVKSGAPDEGQAGPNPGMQDEGQAGPNPGNDTVSQTLSTPGVHARPNLEPTPCVHAGPNLKYTDADTTDATRDTEAESMVSVTIHQDNSAIPPMTSQVIDLVSVPDSPTVHRPLPTTTTTTATTTTIIMTTIPLPP
ncbi:hypothetical protein Tco_1178572 [Tanacetum coccineum]